MADYVAGEVLVRALEGCNAHKRYVHAVLVRECGASPRRINLTDVAADLGMSLGTSAKHRRRVLNWLLPMPGEPKKDKDGNDIAPSPRGQEVIALAHAEEVLRGGGFVE